ncbi:MAG: hypothetical protein M1829_001643 [Trizodia sp. TS-e1964]|nr:MAG: hypothetical protein M1829_001643 [Trizodia sp. TS-e1964]
MARSDAFNQLDDESFALKLQLEDIEVQRELQTGKWTENNAPDFALAFDDYEAELNKALSLVEDLKLAHSIARAVDSDAVAIEESAVEEAHSAQDRHYAISLNEGRNLPPQRPANPPDIPRLLAGQIDWDDVLPTGEPSVSCAGSSSTATGSLAPYVLRQKAIFQRLPQLKVECSVCGDSVHPHAAVQLACNDRYCKPCLKSFFLRVTKDESLFPPKCHRQPIDISLIEADFSPDELATYKSAEQEFTSRERLYCADPACAKFIPMEQRTRDCASCAACGAGTCIHCKALEHGGACPEDKSSRLSSTLQLKKAGKLALDAARWSIGFRGVII